MYFAQRVTVHPRVRKSVAGTIALAIRLRHGDGTTLEDGASQEAVQQLRADGVARLAGMVVSPDRARRLLDYFRAQTVVLDGRPVRMAEIPEGEPRASYSLSTIVANADVREILTSPAVLDIAARYLGCRPTLSSLGVRWSFPSGKAPSDVQRFHRDPDDWRFLKLFVYLTEVTPGSGPHIYVKRSHRTGGDLRARFFEASELRSHYGEDSLDEITGPPGTAFIADTYGIHTGLPPTDAPRLLLQAQYSLLPVFAFRYQPVEAENWGDRPDRYLTRLLVS